MHRRKLERMTLAALCLAACMAFFGACVAIVHAHAQEPSSVRAENSQTLNVSDFADSGTEADIAEVGDLPRSES
jgi:hypothetical protein